MKAKILLFITVITSTLLVSCTQDEIIYDGPITEPGPVPIALETVLTDYDLWYVDYHSTEGFGDVPFMSMAFTLSFRNGRLYANNNLAGIGFTGNGYGIQTGTYTTYDAYSTVVTIDHLIDGITDFEVYQHSGNVISLYNAFEDVTYYLEGYYKNEFDYDYVFYDNIEYFLQDYYGWEKVFRSNQNIVNSFDYENYLSFTPENITTFYSSEDGLGIDIVDVLWDYVGAYEVFDVEGYDNLKILTLDYDLGYNEEFELSVINDELISLYHINSGVTYEFAGRAFQQYLRPGSEKFNEDGVSLEGRKRTKVERKTKIRKKY